MLVYIILIILFYSVLFSIGCNVLYVYFKIKQPWNVPTRLNQIEHLNSFTIFVVVKFAQFISILIYYVKINYILFLECLCRCGVPLF